MIHEEDVVHTYNGLLLSHEKEYNNTICSNMDGPREIIILSEESQAEKDIYDIISMLNLKKKKMQINLFTKQKQTHRL